MTEEDIISALQAQHKNVLISYGGDGTLVSKWREAKAQKKPILPVRNYGRCQKHEELLKALLECKSEKELSLKLSVNPIIEFSFHDEQNHKMALAEMQLKNKDITSALRFNVFVNNKKYYDNVIADAVIASTPLGSTGYWKSITRTIFRDGFGLTFLAPTVGISSLVLKPTDFVKIEFTRNAILSVASDKDTNEKEVKSGDFVDVSLASDNMSIIGYDEFMCFECRKNRNSTILQDQYIV